MTAPPKSPLLPVAEALRQVLANVAPLETENAAINGAAGRTLADDVHARLTHPPFPASSMDGYAVRASDIASVPVTLTLQGEAAAGRPYDGVLKPKNAVRIFTGAALPDGADCVVIQEDTRANGGQIEILERSSSGDNMRPLGQDFREGARLLQKGKKLNARDVMLAASAGLANLNVIRKPIVAVLATGDELVPPGTPPRSGQIVASNSTALAVLVQSAGGSAQTLGIARDTHESLAEKLAASRDADILITTGGASVGDHDLVRPALENAGAKLDFYKIAMRPGKPMFFGSRPRTNSKTPQRILGLPGNPVSALIGARVFLVPLIASLLGRPETLQTVRATLAAPLKANGPRDHYMRAKLDQTTIPPRVTAFPNQDSALTSVFAAADCLVVIPAHSAPLAAGATVAVLPLDF